MSTAVDPERSPSVMCKLGPDETVTGADLSAAGFNNRLHEWLRANADDIIELVPEPGQRWAVVETELGSKEYTNILIHAVHKKVIRHVKGERINGGAKVFVTHPLPYRYAEQVVERSGETLPCGHRGISNVSMDPPTYTCMCTACDETFDRAAVEDALDL